MVYIHEFNTNNGTSLLGMRNYSMSTANDILIILLVAQITALTCFSHGGSAGPPP